MVGKNLRHQRDTPRRGHVRQPDQAGVRLRADVDQRPEISVDRDQNPPFVGGEAQ